MISILCHSVGPYHAARFLELEKNLQDFMVVELFIQQKSNPWNNMSGVVKNRITLFDKAIDEVPIDAQVKELLRILNNTKPRVVISVGYSEKVMRSASSWAKKNGAYSIMMTDTWKEDRKRYFPLEMAKSIWCKKMYDAIFVSGIRSFDYFKSLGIEENRIWRGVDVVDNDYFFSEVRKVSQKKEEARKQFNLPQNFFLCCSRLSKEKNIKRLLEAFLLYQKQGGKWDLVLVGNGPQRSELEEFAKVTKGIKFMGWKQYPDLPLFYGLANCFILPSISEPWGLVVNEAMASDLPILVSRKCGCLPELCWRGLNGWDFDPLDIEGIADLMLSISKGKYDLSAMGRESHQIINNYTPNTWARTLVACLTHGNL